jgi:hypothetical protein
LSSGNVAQKSSRKLYNINKSEIPEFYLLTFYPLCDILLLNQEENIKKGDAKMKVQVTLFDKSGKYRPISTLVPVPDTECIRINEDQIKNAGIRKIMIKRGWSKKDLIQYNYLTCKMRIYPEED